MRHHPREHDDLGHRDEPVVRTFGNPACGVFGGKDGATLDVVINPGTPESLTT